MDDLTLHLIYGLKEYKFNRRTIKEEAISILSEYTETPEKYYTDKEIERISQLVFVDFLRTADNPAFEVREFFEAKKFGNDDTFAILNALRLTQVRDENGYVNGFRDEIKGEKL